MGILDFITKTQENLMAKAQEKLNDAQKKIETTSNEVMNKTQWKIDELQKRIETFSLESLFEKKESVQKQSRTAKQIIKRFYADYPEPPYISNDRKANWIKEAEMFPSQCIIPKVMMQRYADGLLPGHIYMLHWLKRYTNKKVPAYFEYKYGLDFDKEKMYLYENGYLGDNYKPTPKGEDAINQHFEVIQNHTKPKQEQTTEQAIEDISPQIIAMRDSLVRNGFVEYEYLANRNCCEICAKLNRKHFALSKLEIGVNAPPMHDGCSCSIAAYSDRKEYDEWLNHLSKGGTTKEWEKRKKH